MHNLSQGADAQIINIHEDDELEYSVLKESLTTASDGKIDQMAFYNLDMILSVGYRVKSKKAIETHR